MHRLDGNSFEGFHPCRDGCRGLCARARFIQHGARRSHEYQPKVEAVAHRPSVRSNLRTHGRGVFGLPLTVVSLISHIQPEPLARARFGLTKVATTGQSKTDFSGGVNRA